MPSTSKKQHNFMAAIAHNPAFAKKVGIPQSVGKDFNEADKGRKFNKGGTTQQRINKQDTKHGKLDLPVANLNRMAGMKGGGSVKKFKEGGAMENLDTSQTFKNAFREARKEGVGTFTWQGKKYNTAFAAPKAKATAPSGDIKVTDAGGGEDLNQGEMSRYNAKGGLMKESKGMMFMKKKGAPASMMGMKHGGMHKMPYGKMMKDSAMKKMNMGGMSKYAKGGGIESRGKTQGTIIKMATGGSVSSRADGIAQRGKTKFKNY